MRWHSVSEIPEFDGVPVNVWICKSNGKVVAGVFVRDPNDQQGLEAWFTEDGDEISQKDVRSWISRKGGELRPTPDPVQ